MRRAAQRFASAAAAAASSRPLQRRALACAVAVASVTTVAAVLLPQARLHPALAEAAKEAPPAPGCPHAAAAASACRPPAVRLQAALTELQALLGPDRVSTEHEDVAQHSSDAYSYHKADEHTDAAAGGEAQAQLSSVVVYPESTEQVSEAVKICARHRVRMIPYGSGTSLEGHTSAPSGGVFIDVSRMQSIHAVHVSDMDCVVEPGISWNNLNAELKKHELFYPVDPGPGASIGGMVATSCSGTNAVRYGTMKWNVLNLTVVLPDGRIVKTGNRARKSSAGYDLTRLFIGSEGTLGIVTEITLRLSNIPEATAVATCSFDSLASASKSVIELLQRGVRVGCVELLDDGCVRAVNAYAGLSYPAKPATLFFKFTGSTAGVQDDVSQAASITARHGAGPLTFATEEDARERIWEARKGALWGCIAYRAGCEAWTTDVCVPISRMAECIEATKADLLELSGAPPSDGSAPTASSSAAGQLFPSAVVGHVGDGNFHVIMMLDPHNPRELSVAREVNERMVRRAIAMEGTCTGEHGVGIGKKKYLEAELGKPAIGLMRDLKRTLDPHNLMNPGKVFDMDEQIDDSNSGARKQITNPQAHKTHGGCC